jgi:class 3 adenylate cyclase
MSSGDLFGKEEAVIAAAEERLAGGGFASDADRGAYAELFDAYQRLFRTTRRLMRLSDRNERELSALAEKQREAGEQIARKNRELETVSNKLAKYLSPQVYQSIFTGQSEVKLGSRRKKLTVFFSDIAGFTEASEKMEPEDLTQLLNQYLAEMSAVALAHGATIDKYIGDAIMIFFGDPESRGTRADAVACVEMAIAMQQRLGELAAIWRRSGIEAPLRARMGIHTGYCTVGNFGSDERMDYTIIGGTVNLAARLEEQAPSGGILISYETWAQVRDAVHCEEAGTTEVRGLPYPVTVYRALDLYRNLASEARPLAADLPHLKLNLDVAQMCPDERRAALDLLGQALDRLRDPAPASAGAKREDARVD